MRRQINLIIGGAALVLSILACSLPGPFDNDPFSDVIPDLTGTAFFSAILTPSPTQPPASTATIPAEPSWTPSPSPSSTLSLPTETEVPSVTQPNIVARNGPLIAAQYFSSAPVIDGSFGEWNFPSYSANSVVYGANQWIGSSDHSASIMVGWDEQNLYLAATIQDDIFVQTATGENIFKGDSLELLVDTNLQADLQVEKLSPDDFQLGIKAGSPLPGQSTEAYLWFPASIKGSRTQVKIGSTQTSSGYLVEASIPWNVFEITAQTGLHIGFAFSVSDNDASGQAVQQSMISTVPERQLTDPTTWGDLVLVK